ncbi:MAG: polysaccharide biosynthesis tyrosine autokinase [Candidatus Promineifilaceae bacterium]|nr:polysaccharide biosynthesis tyrosine autokinase [Candidatus Promineifilaceae bacterium]
MALTEKEVQSELRQLLLWVRRWLWLIILGAILGALAGYLAAAYQEPVYQATTRVMVVRPRESAVTAERTFGDQELIETYISLLTTKPVLAATSERLGVPVQAGQIEAWQTAGTRLLQVTVRSTDPERAALIANTLVAVLIEHNNLLQSQRFTSSEESLVAQIERVEDQMDALENTLSGGSEESVEQQQEDLDEEILDLQERVIRLRQEIEALSAGGLTPAEREDLLEKRVALAETRSRLALEQAVYTNLLRVRPTSRDLEVEAEITDMEEQVMRLEHEIENIMASATTLDPEVRDVIAERRAELARLELALDRAEERYLRLSVAGNTPRTAGDNDDQQRTQLSLYQELYINLLSTYESVRLARLQNTPNLVMVEEADVPNGPVRPQPVQLTLFGGSLGLLAMAGLAFVRDQLDDTIKSPEMIQALFDLPVIGFIAETDINSDEGEELVVRYQPRAPVSEAFRSLRTNLEFAAVDRDLGVILVTSANPGEGKTMVAANLAAIFAQSGSRVVLIEGDLRRPRVHKITNLSNRVGLSDVFRGRSSLREVYQPVDGMEMLSVITSGGLPPNPTELVGSSRMDEILQQLQGDFDTIIIDSPPVVVADPATLASKVDGVLLVVQPGGTTVAAVEAAVRQLQRVTDKLVGVVFNRIPRRLGAHYSSYEYYRNAYYRSNYYIDGSGNGTGRSGKEKAGKLLERLFSG